ncbi:putative acyl-CoA thioester hydrolase HI_0827 [Agrobacterium fabrum]|uniref:acyl-CoA thioesterase n=1 Tax=Agrobacterium fabrum TaxID=1176649 RepID=UPI001D311F56|nr:acyl-CoA thioesterase [Agrobacterium fabrum]CAH0144178.1 putative acyl-CoA thioester hydrolase HI_0827 [Agrobacterium fabrum]CAH0191504.1 putative acyl-CoA thioester hydrolase HI_0827 [Agrobacterium fabrum]
MTEIATIEKPAQHGATTRLIDIVFPGDTNHHGTLFGGTGLALMDRVAFIAATRFGRTPFVTASCERIDFRQPARIGHIVEFTARPVKAGRRSLTVEVEMVAETIIGRQRHTCTRGIFHMVAIPEGEDAASYVLPELLTEETPDPSDAVTMVEIVFPDQANSVGRMFGGEAIAYMTKAAFVAASRYCGKLVVLASSERIDFARAIEIGEIVEAEAHVERVGRSSMSIQTKLCSENLLTGERHITATGHFTMVAVDKDHRPAPIRDPAEVVSLDKGGA